MIERAEFPVQRNNTLNTLLDNNTHDFPLR